MRHFAQRVIYWYLLRKLGPERFTVASAERKIPFYDYIYVYLYKGANSIDEAQEELVLKAIHSRGIVGELFKDAPEGDDIRLEVNLSFDELKEYKTYVIRYYGIWTIQYGSVVSAFWQGLFLRPKLRDLRQKLFDSRLRAKVERRQVLRTVMNLANKKSGGRDGRTISMHDILIKLHGPLILTSPQRQDIADSIKIQLESYAKAFSLTREVLPEYSEISILPAAYQALDEENKAIRKSRILVASIVVTAILGILQLLAILAGK